MGGLERLRGGLSTLALLGVAAGAQGQAEDASEATERESARRLGSEGLRAYDTGAYEVAVQRLSEAIAFHDAPTLRLYRARALGRVGRWVAACRDYDSILRSSASENESSVTAEARVAAKQESADAYRRPAKLNLAYAGLAPRFVRVDGVDWPLQQFGTAREIDPGDHVLEVERPDSEPLHIKLTFGQGESLTISLDTLQLLRRSTSPHSSAPLRLVPPLPDARPSPPHAATPRSDQVAPVPRKAVEPPKETLRLEFGLVGWIDKSRSYHTDDPALSSARSDGNTTRVAATWFPLQGEWRNWLGLTASWETGFREDLHRELLGGLRARHASGPVEFGFQLVAGTLESGRLDIPALSYGLVQPSIDARWRGGEFSVSGTLALPLPFNYGEQAESRYPDIAGSGYLAGLGVEYRIWPSVGLQFSGQLRRFLLELSLVGTTGLGPTTYAVSIVDVDTSWLLGVTVNL